MKIPVSVRLGELSLEILSTVGNGTAADLERAVRIYLNDSGTSNPGWPYPAALGAARVKEVELDLRLDEGVWAALEEEAATQEISASQLASHAVLYYAAELDAGRVTQRILDSSEDETAE